VELRELRAFVAVVQAGGLSAAARRLHLSQPALSQTVRALERELGVQLLVRSSTGAVPTDAGRVLCPRPGRCWLGRTSWSTASVPPPAPGAAVGLLRLGVPLELHPDLLPPALAAVRAEWPQVRLQPRHASSSAQLAALRAGELDVALVRELPCGEQVDALPVLRSPSGCCWPRTPSRGSHRPRSRCGSSSSPAGRG
jgi:DNA-binding transcriptional LysR family regulator